MFRLFELDPLISVAKVEPSCRTEFGVTIADDPLPNFRAERWMFSISIPQLPPADSL